MSQNIVALDPRSKNRTADEDDVDKGAIAMQHKQKLFATAACRGSMQTVQPVNRKMKTMDEPFWNKNSRMERPVSPHITIYKFELPALLSGSHRATGFVVSGMTALLGMAALAAPDHLSHYVEIIKSWDLPIWFLFPAKCLVSWPVIYHMCNGVRHLTWDTGRGFEMGTLYKSGYFVVATSFLVTFGFVYCCST